MSKALKSFGKIVDRSDIKIWVVDGKPMNQDSEDLLLIQSLVDRDEAKPVLHENVMNQFGKCPVCNSSVAIQFHSDFCGKCGNRLKWRGEGK